MKNKILFRLITYFVTTFLVFSLIIGIVFSTFFARHNLNVHKVELEKRAVNVAGTLSEMLEGATDGQARQGTGYGAYRRFIEDISLNEVWVVDRGLNPISCGSEHHDNTDHTELWKELPDWTINAVIRAIDEKRLISESSNTLSQAPVIITAMPIIMDDGNVLGAALLLSHHVSDVAEITRSGVMILILSMGAAVIISVFIAVILSSRFTKPLGMMKATALRISGGDYSVKTGVKQPDEIGELAAVIDDMAGRLEASLQEQIKFDNMRRDFIANISHELRTPVTVIRGSLEAICDEVVSDPAKIDEYHNQMFSESVYLERLVSDLLDLARLQNPDFSIEFSDLDLKDVMEDVIRGMKRIAEPKNVNLIFDCTGRDFSAIGDYSRLRQMLIIIIDNAIKFSPDGKTVDIILSETESGKCIIIRDEGCGISPDDLPFVFERFYKQRSEENKTGTGLGLAIAKQIADRHGISIKITSNQGEGTEFAFDYDNDSTQW